MQLERGKSGEGLSCSTSVQNAVFGGKKKKIAILEAAATRINQMSREQVAESDLRR
jgi:hypothetical protein